MENILILNLLGKRFHIPLRIVADHPQTLLGNQSLRSKYYREDIKDYYFERSPLLFPYILTYYTLDRKIFCPHHIPKELLENECKFFKLINSKIYREINKMPTYQYFQRPNQIKENYFITITPLIVGILFMITTAMETLNNVNNTSSNELWSITYFIELLNTILLTSIIIYQIVHRKKSFQYTRFLLDLFSTILTIFVIIGQNVIKLTNFHFLNSLIMLFKTLRLFIVVAHLRLLRLVIQTFIQRYKYDQLIKYCLCFYYFFLFRLHVICTLVFINIIITGSFSEIVFAFERRHQERKNSHVTMKSHFDAFWWATSLRFILN